MATTDPTLACQTLDLLRDSGARFAVLHDADSLSDGTLATDVDLAVEVPPGVLVTRLLPNLHARGLHPIVVWNYDVGGATTVVLATRDAADGVQIDLICDATGIGLDSVVAPALIDAATPDDRGWPRVKAVHELLYLLRKRQRKGDRPGLEPLLERARSLWSKEVEIEAFRILSGRAARSVCRMVCEESVDLPAAPRRLVPHRRLARLGGRCVQPIGFWAQLDSEHGAEEEARAVAARFARFLPVARFGSAPPGLIGDARWMLSHVAPVRWRAGLLVSWSRGHRHGTILRPDLRVRAIDVIDVSRRIVLAMETRQLTHIRRYGRMSLSARRLSSSTSPRRSTAGSQS